MRETERRRAAQIEYNTKHGIIPQTISTKIHALNGLQKVAEKIGKKEAKNLISDPVKLAKYIESLRREMKLAAKDLEFEEAAKLRDQINVLEEAALELI